MTIQTLKSLIEYEFDRATTISEFKSEVYRLIELYENEDVQEKSKFILPDNNLDLVPYASICACNPKNGGSGVCGCTMGNNLVINPKSYGCGDWINTDDSFDIFFQ